MVKRLPTILETWAGFLGQEAPLEKGMATHYSSTTDLDSVLKSRDVTLPRKVYIAEAMVFPVVMYGCESWTIKKAERRRTDASKLGCWRRLLKSPMDSKEIKPVNPRENQP